MERDSILVHPKANLAKAQHFMKKYVDTKKRLLELNIDIMVLINLQPYR